jgi:hypothetical protein
MSLVMAFVQESMLIIKDIVDFYAQYILIDFLKDAQYILKDAQYILIIGRY